MNEKTYHKFKQEVKAACAKIGMEPSSGNRNDNSFEKYFYAFATVSLTILPHSGKLYVEKYYDSEIINDNLHKEVYFRHTQLDEAIAQCKKFLTSIHSDEPIFGGIE